MATVFPRRSAVSLEVVLTAAMVFLLGCGFDQQGKLLVGIATHWS
jgi:hypothetical protein